jgi:hypothetical protein
MCEREGVCVLAPRMAPTHVNLFVCYASKVVFIQAYTHVHITSTQHARCEEEEREIAVESSRGAGIREKCTSGPMIAVHLVKEAP